MAEISKEVIKAYALKNAVEHGGMAVQGAVLSGLFAEGLEKSKVKETMPVIQKIIKEVNDMKIEEQKEAFKELQEKVSQRKVRAEGELPALPEAEKGKVIMRLAPFPSGPLHIGNARALILNHEYCKIHDGQFVLFIDDTIGSENKQIEPDAYKLIPEGIEWLIGEKPKKILYKSDRTEKYYAYAEEMIKKGYMYACDCPAEKFRTLKEEGVDCPCRHLPEVKHLERWKKMFNKETKPGELVIRLKTSMQDPDPAFRDRVMFKISDRTHPRTKNKFRVYPSMEFSWGIDDHVIGTTHVLRGIEHQMSTRVQDFIRKIFSWKNPISIYNGHLQIEGVKISKSKGAKEVKMGEYIGWNDPRLWSLQSLKDRGFKQKAIREFILNMGITKSNSIVPVEVLYSANKKYLEKIKSYHFIEQPEKIKISGAPQLKTEIPFNKKEQLGTRTFETTQEFFIEKNDYDLMQNGNYYLSNILTFKSDQVLKLKPRTFSFISQKSEDALKTITWLPANAKNIKVNILMPEGNYIEGLGEESLNKIKEGTTIYFERFGFATLHKKEKDTLNFFFLHA